MGLLEKTFPSSVSSSTPNLVYFAASIFLYAKDWYILIYVFVFDAFLCCIQQLSAQGLEEVTFSAWSYLLPPDKLPSISLRCFLMQICKTGIKIHPAAVCGGFPLDSFPSESSKCEGVEKQPAVLHVSCSSEQETLPYQDQKLLLARCPGQCCLFFLFC